jgi:eukaryotic-like serine/threonine-protein kinase
MSVSPRSLQRELFELALELPVGERREFIERECREDPALCQSVLELLVLDADPNDAVAERLMPVSRSALNAQAQAIGQRIGAYTLIEEIGSGGMGTVFLAKRADGQFQQRVAIKLIRGFPTIESMERFKRERDLLSQLAHPHIARLLDGGSTESGQPWLAMEFIEGVTLSTWLANEQPDLARRLRLFRALCAAVQHAHQHLVIHRDIKPGNVLVRNDDDPILLDFGIGKLLDEPGSTRATTMHGALTPDYASPEQLAGRPTSIASDIFALGLLLYELLAGRALRDARTGPGKAQSPTRPSDTARRSDQPWLRTDGSRIRGDLDWITLKALRSEPERRYSSAAALADDVARFESGRVVEAAPERLSYVFSKWLHRHPIASAATVLVLLLIAGFSWQLKSQRDRALQAEHKAVDEAAAANEVTQFLLGLFAGADPQNARGRDISARDMLEQGRRSLDQKLLDQPLLRARLLLTIGTIYTSIGQPEPSIAALTEATQLLERDAAADPLLLANALNELGRAQSSTQNYLLAVKSIERGLQLRAQYLPAEHPDIGHSCSALGVALQGLRRFDEAEVRFHQGLKIFEDAGKAEVGNTASLLHNLGLLARARRQFDSARDYYQRALSIKQQLYGVQHPLTLNTIEGLAINAAADGELDEAERWLHRSHDLRIKVNGAVSIDVARSFNELASLKQDRGRLVAAEHDYRAALALHEKLNTADTMAAAGVINNLASVLEERGDLDAAQALQRRSLTIRIRTQGEAHDSVHRARHNLARQLFAEQRLPEAAAEFALALAGRRQALGETHPETLDSALYTGLVAHAMQPMREVQPLRALLDQLRAARGKTDPTVLRGMRGLIETLPINERDAALQSLLRDAESLLGSAHPFVAEVRLRSAEQRLAAGDLLRARQFLAGAAAPLRTELLPTATALRRLARVEQALR